ANVRAAPSVAGAAAASSARATGGAAAGKNAVSSSQSSIEMTRPGPQTAHFTVLLAPEALTTRAGLSHEGHGSVSPSVSGAAAVSSAGVRARVPAPTM